MSIPLPAIFSNCNHKVCITKTKRTTKNVAKKGIKKLLSIYLFKIFKKTQSFYNLLIKYPFPLYFASSKLNIFSGNGWFALNFEIVNVVTVELLPVSIKL